MKYQLKDICTITKGATGIMKADGGKYPLVALSDERRSHSEFQFDANAVIVPLISSTGHGHASMKRVHYQEGKFALGNILCAVIPNDEAQLNAKYLHLLLQQFKETLLVPLMKGAANVSLPMNKLADVEIEVPSLNRQLEIIALEEVASEYKKELEERLIDQDGDVTKLRWAILREAMQGKLTKQNPKDGDASDLLKKIKCEQEKLIEGKKLSRPKPLPPIDEDEIQFDLPKNWICCRLGEAVRMIYGDGLTKAQCKVDGKYPVYGSNGIVGYYDKFLTEKKTIIIGRKGSAGALNKCNVPSWTTDVAYYVEESENFNFDFLFYLLKSLGLENLGKGIKPGVNRDATS
ncbi:MAG TPA: hypothetical protein DCR40_14195 [Prolixibacteraceae bacterium]|nr:hypothetical protein [Prolixibacteraceae bacterium]